MTPNVFLIGYLYHLDTLKLCLLTRNFFCLLKSNLFFILKFLESRGWGKTCSQHEQPHLTTIKFTRINKWLYSNMGLKSPINLQSVKV